MSGFFMWVLGVKLRSFACKASTLMMELLKASFLGGTGQHSSRNPVCPQSPRTLATLSQNTLRKLPRLVHHCGPLGMVVPNTI